MALLLVLAALVGLYFAADGLIRWLTGAGDKSTAAPETTPAPVSALSFKEEEFLPLGDLNGDGTQEQVALGKVEGVARKVALVTGEGRSLKQVGDAITVGALRLKVASLPSAGGPVLVLPRQEPAGDPKYVTIPGGQALQAAGGEPSFEAWRPDMSQGLVPVNYYELAAPAKPVQENMLVVDKYLNVLWLYENGKLAATYRVATGRFLDGPPPSAANQTINYITPVGTYTITHLEKNPTYYKENIPGGDPKNPLGNRFMGFSVYPGDNAVVWAIHGTNEPDSIGHWASDGCIRLNNDDAVKLFDRVKAGMQLQIIDSRPR